MLRDRFRINRNHKELTRNVLSNIRKGFGDIINVLDFIRNVPVKELCQGIVN
jgi:hypothetical protein